MKLIKCISAVFIILALSACNNKQTPIDQLSDLESELAVNAENYSEEDWEEVGLKLDQIEQDLAKYDYTDEELKEIGRIKGKCLARMSKAYFNSAVDEIDDYSKILEGAVEGFLDELDSSLDEVDE